MVMQPTADFFGWRFKPQASEHEDSRLTRIQTADLKVCNWMRYHLTGVCCDSMCLPTAWSLLRTNF